MKAAGLAVLQNHSKIRRMSYGYVPAPPLPPPAPRKSWFSRNWKWFIPTVIGVPVLMVVVLIGGIVGLLFSMMKSSEPYQHAVSIASHDSRVTARLGTPVSPRWYVTGNIKLNNDSGNADLAIPLEGPQGRGTVHVAARKSAGTWSYERVEVEMDGAPDHINLLSAAPATEDK
jgi:Cytochrome oxidase complex assembly protein 1